MLMSLWDGTQIKKNGNSGSNELLVNLEGHQCPQNTTNTPLLADAVFTGSDWQSTLDYGVISIDVVSDQDSATDGLVIQWSNDAETISNTDEFTILANKPKTFTFGPANQYVRLKYTNGSVDQSSFSLQTLLRKVYVKPSSHRIDDAIIGEDDAELVKAVITGLAPDGSFKNVLVTNGGNQKISIEEFESDVSTNSNTQLKTTLYDEGGIPISVDDTTETLQVIGYEHHEIHSGSHYNFCDYALNQASGAIIEFVMTTPNTTKWTHLVFEVSASDGATIELYEGTSGITGGTSITPRNNNRNLAISNPSSVTIVKDPSAITTDGNRSGGYLAGGGKTAGAISRNNEFILAQNTSYLVRIISLAVSNDIGWCADWYEHINKN